MLGHNSVPKKLLWFVALWASGVFAVGIVGLVIKMALAP
ncbi:hypothetical protein SAMN05892877_11428 [Rhizobium subbaraonis]|uniref:DUF2474 family protein n=1 Tax=Rhizobium subbaraonis TaxID=908946 RepID=A0A285UTF9_9HYPH|nr:hypothetical protein SAMN05892877_11428 [Rhizobium subbaraonis]